MAAVLLVYKLLFMHLTSSERNVSNNFINFTKFKETHESLSRFVQMQVPVLELSGKLLKETLPNSVNRHLIFPAQSALVVRNQSQGNGQGSLIETIYRSPKITYA